MQLYTEPRERSVARSLVPVVAIVVGLSCLGGIGLGLYLHGTADKASAAPRAVTEAFVADLAAGDTAAAYVKLCARSQTQYTEDEFAAKVIAQPRPTEAKITGYSVHSAQAEVHTTLTLDDGTSVDQDFVVAKEAGDWKVCGAPY
jgi:hypothetical protein